MEKLKKLSDTEFEVMKAVWESAIPITTNALGAILKKKKRWRQPTINSFLNRLVDKGYLRTEKTSKERYYYPLVDKQEYLKFETRKFLNLYYESSFTSLINTLHKDSALTQEDLSELSKLIDEHEV